MGIRIAKAKKLKKGRMKKSSFHTIITIHRDKNNVREEYIHIDMETRKE